MKDLAPEDRSLPFILPELTEAIKNNPELPLVIVEGEKDALALWSQGTAATCNAAGAGKWRPGHSRVIIVAGFKDIVIWADRDEPGRNHAKAVAESLREQGYLGALTLRELHCPDGCKDASDAIAHHPQNWQDMLGGLDVLTNVDNVDKTDLPGETVQIGVDKSVDTDTAPVDKYDPEPDLSEILRSTGLLGQYSKALASAYQVSPGFAFATALGVAGIPVGLGATVEITQDWREPGVLHLLVIAPPAERKTPVLSAAMGPIWDAEKAARQGRDDEIAKTKAEHELLALARDQARKDGGTAFAEALARLESHQVPARFSAVASKATAEALETLAAAQGEDIARIAVVSDEAGGVFGDLGRYNKAGTNYEVLLAGYDAGHYTSHRVTRGEIRVTELRVPLLLMGQPSAWAQVAGDAEAGGRGLLARLCPVRPESLVGVRFGFGEQMPESLSRAWCERLTALFSEAYADEQPEPMRLDAAAFQLFVAMKDEIESEMTALYSGDILNGWAGKQAGRIVRIAATIHAMATGNLAGRITADEIGAALAIGEWLAWHARREYGGEDVAPALSGDATRLWEWAKHRQEFTARDAYRSVFRGLRARFDVAAEQLEKLGLIERLDSRGSNWRGGEQLLTVSTPLSTPNGDITAGQRPLSTLSTFVNTSAEESGNEQATEEVVAMNHYVTKETAQMTELTQVDRVREQLKKEPKPEPRDCAECGRRLVNSTGTLCKPCAARRLADAS
ncbi:YfjI family protein [Ferrimicrobium sp.]|uniref:YfjI family protein n=1 Tax=Ferrimicrobium sp. TaxID=2926050 RepID=UPI002612AC89|nr:DUF3987 domain-containing protein [Ferrimicrobium sp.]